MGWGQLSVHNTDRDAYLSFELAAVLTSLGAAPSLGSSAGQLCVNGSHVSWATLLALASGSSPVVATATLVMVRARGVHVYVRRTCAGRWACARR